MFPSDQLVAARSQRSELAVLVGKLDPDSIVPGEAEPLWEAFDGMVRLATSARTLVARKVEEGTSWRRSGSRSPAEHLARKAGTSTGAARSELETSRRLRALPGTESALRRGELSGPQAAAVADGAAADPGAEQKLLRKAKTASLAELRDESARIKAAADPDPDATWRRLHAERRLRRFVDGEGAWNLTARGTVDAGSHFNTALEPIIDELFTAARRQGRREPREAYAFDALIELALRCTAGEGAAGGPGGSRHGESGGDGDAGGSGEGEDSDAPGGEHADVGSDHDNADGASGGGDGGPSTSTDVDARLGGDGCGDHDASPSTGGDGALSGAGSGEEAGVRNGRGGASRRNPTHLALLRLDLEALLRGGAEGDELCEITGLGPVPVRIARQLLGDAVLKLVLTKGADVANVTHLGRGPNAAQRIALLWSSPTCVVEGCSAARTEADHRIPYAQTHHTRLDELDGVCKHHHDLKTYEGWALVAGSGRRPMVAPDDPRHPAHGPPAHDPVGDAPPAKSPPGTPGCASPAHAPPGGSERTPPEQARPGGSERAPPSVEGTGPAPTLFGP